MGFFRCNIRKKGLWENPPGGRRKRKRVFVLFSCVCIMYVHLCVRCPCVKLRKQR